MERTTPSHSSPRDTSPVLASIAEKAKNQERVKTEQGLVASLTKAIWRRSPNKKDEFWEALQSHYNYLMDGELIETCKEATGELSWGDVSPTYTWTYKEYMERYRELMEWLEKIKGEVEGTEMDGIADVAVKQTLVEELSQKGMLHKLIIEQAPRLIRRYPNLKEEITIQITTLNSCWEALDAAISAHATRKESGDTFLDVESQIRCLRKWLHEMEGKLRPISFSPGWTLEDLENKFKEHQALQKEIESRGKNVLSVLKLCERLQSEQQQSASRSDEAGHVHRVALNLERRWHAVWLRSLEWQCVLEELIKNYKAGLLPGSSLESSFSDEPLKKYPRLSGGWSGKPPSSCYEDSDTDHDDALSPECSALPDAYWDQSVMDVDLPPPDNLLNNRDYCSSEDDDVTMKTRDVGTDCGVLCMSTNDKGIMVGSTGIAELKADCDGHYENFEIIQDVGYSSESSTHLSNDERGGDLIQVYSYEKDPPDNIPDEQQHPNRTTDDKEFHAIVDEEGMALDAHDSSDPNAEKGLVSRTGPNNATFHFCHIDTDPECKAEDFTSDYERALSSLSSSVPGFPSDSCSGHRSPVGSRSYGRGRRRQWSDSSTLRKVGSARAVLEFLSDAEGSQLECSLSDGDFFSQSHLLTDNEKLQKLGLEPSSSWEGQKEDERRHRKSPIAKFPHADADTGDSIHHLVEQAERLVRREDCQSPEFVSHRSANLESPSWLVEANAKKTLFNDWLRSHRSINLSGPVLPPATVLDSSCDASGEYTSNSEDEHSTSSEEHNNSVILCYRGADSLEQVVEPDTPVAENRSILTPPEQTSTPVRVVMRNKPRASGDRPWSVTELYQRSNRLDLSPFSISESALNKLLSPDGSEGKDLTSGSHSVGTQKDLTSPSSDNMSSATIRKSKSLKSRKRVLRRSDSSSEGHSRSGGSFVASGGSDGSMQRSPSRRRPSGRPKSHSSGSDSSRKQRLGGGASKSMGLSSGTEQYVSEVAVGCGSKVVDVSDTESEPTQISPRSRERTTEELSSVSEQAWDDYQESPYLSEAYSEKLIDDEQIKKLMEFGDDYSTFIGNQSDSTSLSSYSASRRSPSKGRSPPFRSQIPSTHTLEPPGLDSDSDIEDLHHIVEQSSSQLQFSEGMLRKQMAKDYSNPQHNLNFAELIATCQTNVKCLEVIQKHLQPNNSWAAISESDVRKLTETIHRWEMLQTQAQEQQQVTQKIRDVQQEISNLRDSMSSIDSNVSNCTKGIENRDILERVIQEVQAYLASLEDKKDSLVNINVQVHSLLTTTGLDMTHLKEDVMDLYHQWDVTFEKSNCQLKALTVLKSTWLQYETELQDLRTNLQKDRDALSTSTALPPSTYTATRVGTAKHEVRTDQNGTMEGCTLDGECYLAERQAQLTGLQAVARQLETGLAGTETSGSISRELNSTASELRQLQETCRKNLMAGPTPLGAKKRVRFGGTADQQTRKTNGPVTVIPNSKSKRPLLWRVVRAALPIQLAIVVLFCIACLLEPHCCDTLNNFSLSFSPQLRYVRGPPPI